MSSQDQDLPVEVQAGVNLLGRRYRRLRTAWSLVTLVAVVAAGVALWHSSYFAPDPRILDDLDLLAPLLGGETDGLDPLGDMAVALREMLSMAIPVLLIFGLLIAGLRAITSGVISVASIMMPTIFLFAALGIIHQTMPGSDQLPTDEHLSRVEAPWAAYYNAQQTLIGTQSSGIELTDEKRAAFEQDVSTVSAALATEPLPMDEKAVLALELGAFDQPVSALAVRASEQLRESLARRAKTASIAMKLGGAALILSLALLVPTLPLRARVRRINDIVGRLTQGAGAVVAAAALQGVRSQGVMLSNVEVSQ